MSTRFFLRWIVLTMLPFVSAAPAQPKAHSTDKRSSISHTLLAEAKAGDAGAQYRLGRMYYTGEGVLQDYTQAEVWFRKGAEQGDPNSQFMLGGLYHFGQGVPQDDGKAFNWIVKAAQQGHIDAEFYISTCYNAGWGVIPNDAKEVIWLRRAAEQGDARSQFYLGHFYDAGRGVPRDYSEAYFWFDLAASGDVSSEKQGESAKRRDMVAALLTPSEIASLQQRVRQWHQDHPAQPQ
jgi:TPR repeat protein